MDYFSINWQEQDEFDEKRLKNLSFEEKKDRAGSDGKNIKCPHCEKVERIYNLRWQIKTCKFCLVESTKYEWLIDQLDTWRTPR